MTANKTSFAGLLIGRGAQAGLFAQILRVLLRGIEYGRIVVRTPNGDPVEASGKRPGPEAIVTLRNWRPVRRLLVSGDVGFAESYVDGDWDSPDLTAVIELAARNLEVIEARLGGVAPVRMLRRLSHLGNANTGSGSRRNIAFHYDLGNAFYGHWLDWRMIYSSGIFDPPNLTLEQAQSKKVQRVLELLDLSGKETVLEIGCGWGALAESVAQRSARVTAVTLSLEQLAHVSKVVENAGLSGKAEVLLQDYREVGGAFDRIASIEMLEAVGERYWPAYFATLRRTLVPGGTAILQAITIHQDRFEGYRRGADFIQTYVFPGGMLPTREIIFEQARRAGLEPTASEYFGLSYALTLAEWRRRFNVAWPKIEALGFTQMFRRLWNYYLSYCEAGFRAGTIDVGLYVLKG